MVCARSESLWSVPSLLLYIFSFTLDIEKLFYNTHWQGLWNIRYFVIIKILLLALAKTCYAEFPYTVILYGLEIFIAKYAYILDSHWSTWNCFVYIYHRKISHSAFHGKLLHIWGLSILEISVRTLLEVCTIALPYPMLVPGLMLRLTL